MKARERKGILPQISYRGLEARPWLFLGGRGEGPRRRWGSWAAASPSLPARGLGSAVSSLVGQSPGWNWSIGTFSSPVEAISWKHYFCQKRQLRTFSDDCQIFARNFGCIQTPPSYGLVWRGGGSIASAPSVSSRLVRSSAGDDWQSLGRRRDRRIIARRRANIRVVVTVGRLYRVPGGGHGAASVFIVGSTLTCWTQFYTPDVLRPSWDRRVESYTLLSVDTLLYDLATAAAAEPSFIPCWSNVENFSPVQCANALIQRLPVSCTVHVITRRRNRRILVDSPSKNKFSLAAAKKVVR